MIMPENHTQKGLKALQDLDNPTLIRIYKGKVEKERVQWAEEEIAWYDFAWGFFFALTNNRVRSGWLARQVTLHATHQWD